MFSVRLKELDRLLARFLLARARRYWPVLNLLPSPLAYRLLAPTAGRLRHSLEGAILWLSVAAGTTVLLLELLR